METEQFDALTRTLSAAGPNRRQALRALGSLLLGGVAGKFGLIDAADAQAKHPGWRRDERKRQDHVQVTGKKHKKHKRKKHKQPPPLPPGCQHCGTCEMCQDGACAPDPELDLVRCLDSAGDPGGQCHICQGGACVPLPNGSQCNDGDECTWCQNGQCVASDKCCDDCGPGEKCCQGQCLTCPNGGVCGNGTCECSGEFSVFCPPNPTWPNGHCCEPEFNGTAFHSCVGRACEDCPDIWGCHYGIPPWD